jgi:hypothetical protein
LISLYWHWLRLQPGTNKLGALVQLGTLFCVNTAVPQTGKAVDGVCPNVVQACANALLGKRKKVTPNKYKSDRLIMTHFIMESIKQIGSDYPAKIRSALLILS